MKKIILLIFGLIFIVSSVFAFDFYGYTYDTNGNALNATNVTVEVYQMIPGSGPSLVGAKSALSNSSGYFSVSDITGNPAYMYKPIVIHYVSNDADYVGKSLPSFPAGEFQGTNNVSFYLWRGATLNITVYGTDHQSGLTVPKNFQYQIKDTKLGYSVKSFFNGYVNQVTANLPANRNYSIMIYANESFPFSYALNNLSSYGSPIHIDLSFNATDSLKWVSGYATFNATAGFDNFYIIGYIIEPGNMVFTYPIPSNMSGWRWPSSTDQFNPTTGFYNMTLIGSVLGSDILLFATAKNGSNYYGAFKKITLTGASPDLELNFSMQPLAGGYTGNITIQGMDTKYIETKLVRFLFQNSSGSPLGNAFVSASVNYSYVNQTAFTWMTDVSTSDNGTAKLPMLSTDVMMEVFTNEGAPKKTTISSSRLSTDPVNVTIIPFNPGGIDEAFVDLFIDFLVSNSTCDVPEPPTGCSLMPQTNLSEFNPLGIVIGGGTMSFRMGRISNGITVHYINVDLLASGPPDVLFDGSANSSSNSSAFAEAWRFGSSGPTIYDSILLGMPYSDATLDDSQNVSVLMRRLYDENWNVIWNADINTTAQLPDEYTDFNQTLFNNNTHGPVCSTNNTLALCYINTTSNMIWVRIPHFSGTGPDLSGRVPLTSTQSISLLQSWNLISLPLIV